MRRLALSDKKVRGIPRRLRSLRRWAASFSGRFPEGLDIQDRYMNWKIPVLQSIVEGKQAKLGIQKACAQELIHACENLIKSRPTIQKWSRVVAVVCLPDMFSSEICIYADPEYYRKQTEAGSLKGVTLTQIPGKRLSQDWGLELPAGFGERGLSVNIPDDDDSGNYISDHWYFGEI